MSIETCPTDVVAAPAARIWRLITHPAEIARWAGARPIAKPARALAAGDRAVFRVRLGLYVRFDVLEVHEPRQLRLDIRLPLGVTNHEVIVVAPLDERRCRVTFN